MLHSMSFDNGVHACLSGHCDSFSPATLAGIDYGTLSF
jgi:hypothetical protein